MITATFARSLPGLALSRLGRLWALAAVALLLGCASVRQDVPRPLSHAIANPQETSLGREFSRQLDSTPGQSGLHLLVSGQEAFAARAALAEAAQRTLDLQYYIVAQDSSSTQLLYRALRAAQRGVRVRLLIDDMNTGFRDSDLTLLAMNPNVEVRLFNPFAIRGFSSLTRVLELLGNSERLNRRMHNKLWVVDSSVAVLGGRNLADAYFDAASDIGFADLDVLVAGPVVPEISRSFDQYWNSEWSVPIEAFVTARPSAAEVDSAVKAMAARAEQFRSGDYAQSLRTMELGRLVRAGQLPLLAATATVLSDEPGDIRSGVPDKKGAIFPVLRQIIEKAQHEVILVSPYLVPGDRSLEVICGLKQRGVRVRVLTNSLASTDVPLVHAGYARYRPRLLACGVELHELRPLAHRLAKARPGLSSGASLHSKAIIVDGQHVLIGSMNLDPRSRRLNTEVALQIDSAAMGQQLTRLFNDATALESAFRVDLVGPGNPADQLSWASMEEGRAVRHTREPLASAWRQLFVAIFGAFAPEELL